MVRYYLSEPIDVPVDYSPDEVITGGMAENTEDVSADGTAEGIDEVTTEGSEDVVKEEGADDTGALPTPVEMRDIVNVSHNRRNKNKYSYLSCLIIMILLAAMGLTFGLVFGLSSDDSKSPAPTAQTSEFEQVVAFLSGQGVSDIDDLQTEGTPQNRAARWLAEEDGANYAVPDTNRSLAGSSDEAYMYIVRYVLAVNWFALGGKKWKNRLNFMSNKSVCEWNAIVSNAQKEHRTGMLCDPTTSVPLALYLDMNSLSGQIPRENGMLSSLQVWDMAFNSIDGEIPLRLCNMNKLTHFSAGYNTNLNGSIPECISEWKNLRLLFLSNTLLGGSLPLSMRKLNDLDSLFLDDNLLTGDPMSIINELTSLRHLFLDENDFKGKIDDDFVKDHPRLTHVDLSGNSFTLGETQKFPPHLLNMPSLEVLDLSFNELRGPMPKKIATNHALRYLALHDNELNGKLPKRLTNLMSLSHFDISRNNFRGAIPSELGEMSSLSYLFLGDNPGFRAGRIPHTFANLSSLEELSLRNTSRTGNLPEFIGSWGTLTLLDLDSNGFNGTIPESYGQLNKLEFLLLNRNDIEGQVPSTFGNLNELRAVFLDSTGLSGDLGVLCDLPAFNGPTNDTDRDETFVADCGGTSPKINCTCCTLCCEPDNKECSDPILTNLDCRWETLYQRDSTEFVDRDSLAPYDP